MSGMTTMTTMTTNPNVKMECELVLLHHGIKGQRWGIRRFQNKNGGLTPAGRKRYAKNQPGDDAETKAKKTSGDSDEPESKESYEARKAAAVKSGTAKDVLEFKNDLTSAQRKEVKERLEWERDVSKLTPEDVDVGRAKADKFFKNVETVAGYADTAANAWNTFANYYNAFSGSDTPLPKIAREGGGGGGKKKKKKGGGDDS